MQIFEQIPEGEAITWCSPLVVQPKPKYAEQQKGTLEPHVHDTGKHRFANT